MRLLALISSMVPNTQVLRSLKAMRPPQQVKQVVEVGPEQVLQVTKHAVHRKVLASLLKKVPSGQVHTPLGDAGPIEQVRH